jgi:membrane protease YdiL (CAAX protease family)
LRLVDRVAGLPLLYLASIIVAEAATRLGSPVLGAVLYGAILIVGLDQAVVSPRRDRVLLLAVSILSLERLLRLALAPEIVGAAAWAVVAAATTIAAIVIVSRLARFSRPDLGLVADRRVALLAIALFPVGLALGLAWYPIAGPVGIGAGQDPVDLLELLVTFAIVTGIVEEVLFRGLLQRAASERLGSMAGIAYVAVLYTVLAASPWGLAGIPFILSAALCLAALTAVTRSVVPAVAAHVGLNLGVLLMAVLLFGGRVPG